VAIRKIPAIFLVTVISDRHFKIIEAPKECPTKMRPPLILEIFPAICFTQPKSGAASSDFISE
jgi:hypothetical protein